MRTREPSCRLSRIAVAHARGAAHGFGNGHRRGPGRLRGRVAARRARDRRHARRAEAARAHARPDHRRVLRARVLELDARRGARQRRRPAQGRAPPRRLAHPACADATRVPAGGRARGRPRRVLRAGHRRGSGPTRGSRSRRASSRRSRPRRPERRSSSRRARSRATRSRPTSRASSAASTSPTTTPSRPSSRADSIDWDRVFKQSRYGKGAEDGARRGVRELPDRRGAVPRLRGRGGRRAEGRAAQLRGGAVLRGLPAHRGDGLARRDDARVRPDEARGPGRSAHRRAPLRGGAAPPGRRGGHRVQPRRLPDAHDVARAGARPAHDPGPRRGGVPALRQRSPQHVRRRAAGARRADAASRARRACCLAGQITGVEGYVESCAGGFVCGVLLAQSLLGLPSLRPRPRPRRSAA